jgi:hypothetical protein
MVCGAVSAFSVCWRSPTLSHDDIPFVAAEVEAFSKIKIILLVPYKS